MNDIVIYPQDYRHRTAADAGYQRGDAYDYTFYKILYVFQIITSSRLIIVVYYHLLMLLLILSEISPVFNSSSPIFLYHLPPSLPEFTYEFT